MRVWALVGALGVAAVLAAWWGVHADGRGGLDPSELVTLVLLGVAGVLLREREVGRHLGFSLATVVLAATLPLAGAVGAVLVGFVSYACDLRQQRPRTRAFNATMTAAVGGVGAITYKLVGGVRVDSAGYSAAELLLRVGLPLIIAYVVMTVANALAYSALSALLRGTKVVEVAYQAVRSLGWSYLGHVVIAFLLAVLWGQVELGPLSALFVLGPMLAAHWSIGRGVTARREHQETVTSFVAALEQADPASVGHSARVADLSLELAGPLGLAGDDAEALRYAALLHDIGLVAVRTDLPLDASAEDVSYLSAISAHPEAGVAVLSDLPFLADAAPAIAHHHERWDGRGYPSGLEGEDIPLAARIIAVADAFDALTSSRQERPLELSEAVETLRRRAGTHLDPAVVAALEGLVARGLLTTPSLSAPQPGPQEGGEWASAAHGPPRSAWPDHDLPAVSDAFAAWQPDASGVV